VHMADRPIDTAYVEILPDFDAFERSAQRQITNELRNIGKEAAKAGDQVEESFRISGKNAELAFAKVRRSADAAFKDIEKGAKGVEGSFVDINGRLRDSRGRFLKFGADGSAAFEEISSSASTAGQALAGLGAKGGVPGIIALGAAALFASGPVAALGAALADLAGFVVALPAAAAVGAASIVPLVLAFQNFGDAIEAVASGDLEKIDEALKKLSPSARSVAKEVGKLLPSLRGLQRTVQEAFFAPLRGDLTAITRNLLPTLRSGLAGVAGAFGNLFSEVGKFFAAPARLKLINDVFAITKGLVNSLTPVVLKLLGAFEAVAQAILPRFDDMSFAIQGVIGDFADWLTAAAKSGKLGEFFDDAVATFNELVALGKEVGRLIGAVFGGLDDSGRSFLGSLTEMVAKFADFAESDEGKKAIQDTADAVVELGKGLVKIGELVAFFGKIRSPLEVTLGVFEDIGSTVSNAFTTAKDAVVSFVEDAVEVISALPGKIGTWLSSLPGLFQQWMQNAFDAAFFAIGVGIGLVVAAFTRLPGLIVDSVKALPGRLSALWEMVKANAIAAFNNVVSFVQALPARLLSAGQAVVAAVGNFFGRAFDTAKAKAKQAIDSIVGFVKGLPGRLTSFVTSVGGNIANAIKSMLNRAISKINEGIARVDSFLPGDSLPRIPSLAEGGIAGAVPGGRLVRVAEAGQDEAIAPLDKLMAMIQKATGGSGITFAPGAISVQFDGAVPTPQQAFAVGQGLGEGIAAQLQRRDIRTQVRMI
jgi:methyl-accepting chemotaxis protein